LVEDGVEGVGRVGAVEVAPRVEPGALDGERLVGAEEVDEFGNYFWEW
jgi:hypothetical protein